jgi:hypothetical protein
VKTTILTVVLLASVTFAKPQPGLPFLLIWPTARSTALAGAMTGLADEADATFFNPAGLAFQTTAKAEVNWGKWLPDFYQGMFHVSAAGGAPVRLQFLHGRNALVAGSLTYLDLGRHDLVNERGEYIGRFEAWRAAIAVTAATELTRHLAAGLEAKYIRSYLTPEWFWGWWDLPELGIDMSGTGSAWACDIGVLYRPTSYLSVGASATNIGPGITYTSSGERDPLPTMLRLGACWTPVSNRYVRVNVLPELDKVLVGMFWDTTGRVPFSRKLQVGFRDAWKALGVEVTGLGLLAVRLGYFEDMTWNRGGIVLEKESRTEHHNLYDLLTRKDLGKFKSIGLCWGFGIGYKDYFRFDVSSDAAIYDFPTTNWKFALVANDIAGGIRELKQGHEPWEE